MKQAMFYKKLANKQVQCILCPRKCLIAEGKRGGCNVRENINGKLFSLVYGKACSMAIDPIEKKPLFHFAPASQCLSIATVGCNLSCKFCQNWEISQANKIFGKELSSEMILNITKQKNLPGIAWTYTEPTVFYEYFYDTAMIAKKQKSNIYNVWVSNGMTSPEAIKKAKHLIDAVNIDYKGSNKVYQELCNAKLEYIQNALIAYKKAKTWIEITNLIIPKWNDNPAEIKEMCQWIMDNVDNVPLHFSRYYPCHELDEHPTPAKTLLNASEIAEGIGFDFVYVGNIASEKQNTFCPNCKKILIARTGNHVSGFFLIKKGKNYACPNCSKKIPLHGMQWSSHNKSFFGIAKGVGSFTTEDEMKMHE